jgi:molecular chaperone GrpE (heat shock protein)
MSLLRRIIPGRPDGRTRDATLASEVAALRDEVTAGNARDREVLADLAARLDGLGREIGKVGREQLQSTTLLDGQGAALDELADAWQAHLRQRDQEAADARQILAEVETRARLGFVQDLLPIADALGESIRSARELLAERPTALPTDVPGRRSRWLPGSLWSWLLGEKEAPMVSPDREVELSAWLDGLLLVERRLLALLERDGVHPIGALGEPFDPRRHLAVAVASDSDAPDGTVVGEELRGYAAGDRVIRAAEVVVARREDGDA